MNRSLDVSLIKKPHQSQSWTEQQILEMAKCADPVTGPVYFLSNYFYIQHPTRGRMQYRPYEYQQRLLDTYHQYRFCVAMLPRQTGKCVGAGCAITVKNKTTGKIYDMPIEVYHEFIQSQQAGHPPIDISQYEK
jgi:hypothetical protein